MTVIVGYVSLEKHPVLIGDLLISGAVKPCVDISMPTVGHVDNDYPGFFGRSILGLQQKVVVIGDNFIVSWSGNVIAAETVIKDMHNQQMKYGLTTNFLSDYLSNLDRDLKSLDLSIVGYFNDGKNIHTVSYENCMKTSDRFGNVMFSGSGGEYVVRYLNNIPADYTNVYGSLNSLEVSIVMGLGLCGCLLLEEMRDLSPDFIHNLQSFYGGGYELGTFIDGKACKISDITHFFWTAEINGDNVKLNLPRKILKSYYVNEILHIYSLSMNRNQEKNGVGEDPGTWNRELFLVPNFLSEISQEYTESLSEPNVNSMWSCHHIIVSLPDGQLRIISTTYKHPLLNGPLRVRSREDGFSFEFSSDFIFELRSCVLNVWEKMSN